jgi:cation transport ATPase
MVQNLVWAIAYNLVAIPIAGGLLVVLFDWGGVDTILGMVV